MGGHVYLGLLVALIAWTPGQCQLFQGLFGGGGGGGAGGQGGGVGAGAMGFGAGAGAMGFGFPFFMSCSPSFGGGGGHRGPQHGHGSPSGAAPQVGGRPGASPNVNRHPQGMSGMQPGQSRQQGFNMQAFMFGQAFDRPDIPDIPSFPMPRPGGGVTWTGCFCDEMGGIGFGSGECMSFLTGRWRQDRCGRYGLCCTCNDWGMWKK